MALFSALQREVCLRLTSYCYDSPLLLWSSLMRSVYPVVHEAQAQRNARTMYLPSALFRLRCEEPLVMFGFAVVLVRCWH